MARAGIYAGLYRVGEPAPPATRLLRTGADVAWRAR